jgi:hypothetical protein
MRAHNVLCDLLCNSYNRITVEMNLCSFRSVHFLYCVTCIRLVCKTSMIRCFYHKAETVNFSSAHSSSKGPFKVSCPYTLKPPAISWPTFQLAHLCPRLHYTICGSDWLILFSIFCVWPLSSSVKRTVFHIWFTSFLKMEAAALFVNFF